MDRRCRGGSTQPRTNADKRRAVMTLIGHPDWAKRSTLLIARQCDVSPWLVKRIRAELSKRSAQGAVSVPEISRRYTRAGREQVMFTARIGVKAPRRDERG